jgi:quercetin dioxygenase-like cupin family protein
VVPEAPLRRTKYGLVTYGDGWFVINARDSRWRDTGPLGFFCDFEGKKHFPQLGVNLNVLQPGQPMGMYHRENGQEGFLVLAGECLLIVEGEERELRVWDFFHCPPQTEHIIVGAGEEPAVVLAVGARGLARKGIVYTVSKVAQKHGAGVKQETTSRGEAHAGLPAWRRISYGGWLPDR